METDDEEGWVTGPALETVKALKGMQPGDHIKLDLMTGDALSIPLEFHRQPGVLCGGGRGNFPVASFTCVPFRDIDQWQWLINAERQICAWKPKKRTG